MWCFGRGGCGSGRHGRSRVFFSCCGIGRLTVTVAEAALRVSTTPGRPLERRPKETSPAATTQRDSLGAQGGALCKEVDHLRLALVEDLQG